jgi:hypothetical protein
VVPLSALFSDLSLKYAEQSLTVIEVRPRKNRFDWLYIDIVAPPSRIIDKGGEEIIEKFQRFFNDADVEKIMSIPHVVEVIRGVETHTEFFPGFRKTLSEEDLKNITDWFIKSWIIAVRDSYGVNMSYREALDKFSKYAAMANMTLNEYILNISRMFLNIPLNILGIEADKAVWVSSYFNDIIEGRFISPSSNEIVLSVDVININYYIGNKYIETGNRV